MMHADSVLATAFSRDSEMLATASQDGQIKVSGKFYEKGKACLCLKVKAGRAGVEAAYRPGTAAI